MKICFVSTGTFDHIQPYIDYFKINNDVYFVALTPSPERGVKVINAFKKKGQKNFDLTKKKWRYIFSSFRAKRLIKKIKPDIVHAHYATSGGVAAAIIHHPHTVLTVHGSDINESIKSKIWQLILKWIFSRCKYIVAVSEELKQKISSLDVPEKKIRDINVGIEYNKFLTKRDNHLLPGLQFVCNRAFKPIYDHVTILNSFLLLKDKIDFHLTLIGEGPLKEGLYQFVKANGLSESVTFLGRIPNDGQIEIFRKNNFYVSSSSSDGTSLSLLEAMTAGLYPVVTDIPANRRWIKNKQNGLLFPVGDSFALAKCIHSITSNLNTVFDSLEYNQKLVRRDGDRNINMRKILELYSEILAS